MTSNYGNRIHPISGKPDGHRGMDIASPRGTPLTSNVSGKVIAAGNAKSLGYSSTYGNIVVVQDSSGNRHLYAHLDSTSIKTGSTVKKGTVMGKVGSTGNSTGPHVHYEVSKGGKLQNPRNWV